MTRRIRNGWLDTAGTRIGALAVIFALGTVLGAPHAFALSEIKREELPPPQDEPAQADETAPADQEAIEEEAPEQPSVGQPIPLPDPIVIPQDPDTAEEPSDEAPDETADEPVPDILYDLALLPDVVRQMHQRIMEACLSGDIEQLRPLIGGGENTTQLSFGNIDGDPISFLRELSGDSEGQEILAILYEVLAAGYVHLDPGEPGEMYVWPYFFAVPLDQLDKGQRVELFKIVTAGDYEDMKNYGAYIFYRVGISPAGKWLFFVAGD